ncbi:MAG TPA: MarR family transcriptional regulator [Polyangiaceae bacterium]|nr:MarR family transcriptional regulator [Polyangiaceae bacterium]
MKRPPRAKPEHREKTGDFEARLEAAKHESTLQLLFKAARLLDETALERVAAKPGRPRLRRSHMSLFPHVDLGGTRITDLAERLGVTKQAVSQLVDDLVGFGVLAREKDPEDARAVRVVFTEKGREGIFEGLAVLRTLEGELASAIGERQMADLRRALVAILAKVDHESGT